MNGYQKKQSPLRSLMSEANNIEYRGIDSLKNAKKTKNCYLVMDGDDGGQIYLVFPAKQINCNEVVLVKLLNEIDQMEWNDQSMASFYYEIHDLGSIVSGGMGGGKVENDLWVHENLNQYKEKIRSVLLGNNDSIISS